MSNYRDAVRNPIGGAHLHLFIDVHVFLKDVGARKDGERGCSCHGGLLDTGL